MAGAVVGLADSVGADFDLTDLLYSLTTVSVDLVGVDSAGLLLADEHGRMQTVASSHHRTEMLELFQLQYDEGPCVEAYRLRAPVSSEVLEDDLERWPEFVARAREEGVRAAHAVPLQLGDHVVGALGLFDGTTGPLDETDLALARHLAAATTIGILHTRAERSSRLVAEQLQHALNSRVIIEQAKGHLAERHGITLDAAFALLRHHARSHNERLATTARCTIEGRLDLR